MVSQQESARVAQEHALDILMGLYDLDGYTPAERQRKEQQR